MHLSCSQAEKVIFKGFRILVLVIAALIDVKRFGFIKEQWLKNKYNHHPMDLNKAIYKFLGNIFFTSVIFLAMINTKNAFVIMVNVLKVICQFVEID